jgi:hypothetical protein
MERSVMVAKYSFYTSTSNCKMLNVISQLFQIQRIQCLECESIYLRLESCLVEPLIKSSV